jgi:hypothetical protein
VAEKQQVLSALMLAKKMQKLKTPPGIAFAQAVFRSHAKDPVASEAGSPLTAHLVSTVGPISDLQFGVANTEMGVIQSPKLGPRDTNSRTWSGLPSGRSVSKLNRSDWVSDLTNISSVYPVAT